MRNGDTGKAIPVTGHLHAAGVTDRPLMGGLGERLVAMPHGTRPCVKHPL
ncbi:hypothetical protein ACFY1U_28965 [Streptomyces sp. NPDC001351]